MSLSNMNRQAYRQARKSIRENGTAYGIRSLECCFEQEDMLFLSKQDEDKLADRVQAAKTLSAAVAFELTR